MPDEMPAKGIKFVENFSGPKKSLKIIFPQEQKVRLVAKMKENVVMGIHALLEFALK